MRLFCIDELLLFISTYCLIILLLFVLFFVLFSSTLYCCVNGVLFVFCF